ncbi:hypothetical protein Pelo_13978 [Pelomyxa schiedti]|nr:hypothetical protein Pelo_13978 [Pelomyxa schiedti]
MPTGLCLFVVRMNIIMPGLPTLHLKIGAHKGVTEIETTPPVPHSVTVGKWSSSSFEVFTQQQLGDISRVAISIWCVVTTVLLNVIFPPGSSSTPCLNLPPVTALHAANVSRSSASDTALVSGGQVTAAPLTAQAPHNTPLQKVVEQCILI